MNRLQPSLFAELAAEATSAPVVTRNEPPAFDPERSKRIRMGFSPDEKIALLASFRPEEQRRDEAVHELRQALDSRS